jgi:hypothetical protein
MQRFFQLESAALQVEYPIASARNSLLQFDGDPIQAALAAPLDLDHVRVVNADVQPIE